MLYDLSNVTHTDFERWSQYHFAVSKLKGLVNEANNSDNPFFLYSHLGSPHLPYTPPTRDLRRFAKEINLSVNQTIEYSQDIIPKNDTLSSLRRHVAEGCNFSETKRQALVATYDAELRFMD
jgi:hypothetical protein